MAHVTLNSRRGEGQGYKFLCDNIAYDGEGCLTWPMYRLPNGYGMLGYLGKQHYAHRTMCELVKGPPPTPEHEAAHSCGRGKFGCIDPRHLSWKTNSGNALDCREHGTQARNMTGNRGYLTESDVEEIKALKGYLTQKDVAEMFCTSQPTVRDIFTGRSRANRKMRKPLTDAEVLEIRNGGAMSADLVRRLKVTHSTVWRIRNGRAYTSVGAGQSPRPKESK